jgi:transposase-like protein
MSRKNRVYSLEFKQDIVRQILAGAKMSALAREHGIHLNCLAYWVKKYHEGRLGKAPTTEKALERKVEELEQVIGQLTVENRLLKKFLNTAQTRQKQNASSLLTTYPNSEACKGGAKC